MKSRLLYLSAIGMLCLLLVPQAAAQSAAVQTTAKSPLSLGVTKEAYQVTVPPFPSTQKEAGVEFHVGLLSTDNTSAMKTTISYGCQITSIAGCFGPYKNRAIFYLSVLNLSSICTGGAICRVQYPSSGWVVTPSSTYTVTLQQVNPCSGYANPAWSVKISNTTRSFGKTVCTGSFVGKTYQTALAGILEVHNLTQCSELPSTNSLTQQGIHVYSSGTSLALAWTSSITPSISCGFDLAFSNSNHDVQVIWNS